MHKKPKREDPYKHMKRIRRVIYPELPRPKFKSRAERLEHEECLNEQMPVAHIFLNDTGFQRLRYSDDWLKQEAINLVEWLRRDGNVTMEDFANERGYRRHNIYQWSKRNDEIGEMFRIAKEVQQSKILKGGLFAKMNPGFAKFVLCNLFGWKDGAENREGNEVKTAEAVADEIINIAGENTKEMVNIDTN